MGNAMAKRSGGEKVSGLDSRDRLSYHAAITNLIPSVGDMCPFGLWPVRELRPISTSIVPPYA